MKNRVSGILVPVILSGGMGKRLWPLSRKNYPKQFLNIHLDNMSLIQETALRVSDTEIFADPILVCNHDHRFLVAEQMQSIGMEHCTIILEPCPKNTAPALAVAAEYINRKYGADAVMLVLPSDHIIENNQKFLEAVFAAHKTAQAGYLTTFGVNPSRPETGYGYIKYGDSIDGDRVFAIAEFVEKPCLELAQKYIEAGNYLWNSGMFCFPVSLLLREIAQYQPEIAELLPKVMATALVDSDFMRLDMDIFARIPANSIDYAIMEKTSKAAVVPVDCGWTDAGSWSALWDLGEKDQAGNVSHGDNYIHESKNCYIWSQDSVPVAAIGVEDLVVVATKDCVMIAAKDKAQEVKSVVDNLERTNPDLVKKYRQIYRPWGHYDSVDSGDRHQVKRITVKPGASLSLQMHYHRSEHWIVVRGTAHVICGDKQKILRENESIYIPLGEKHRLTNPGKIPLELIEVQSGDYLGEDDIVRFEDTYGRIVQVV